MQLFELEKRIIGKEGTQKEEDGQYGGNVDKPVGEFEAYFWNCLFRNSARICGGERRERGLTS